MKTLKFIGQDKNLFTLTLRKNVNDYFKEKGISTKGNSKMLIKSIFMMILYAGPFMAMLLFPLRGWTIFPISILMGIGMACIGMSVMHDAAHGSFSKKVWLNSLFGSTIYSIGGNYFNWKIQHNIMHHTYTNIEGFDEDINPKGALRLSKHIRLKKAHRFQHIYAFFLYCLMTLARTVNEFGQLNRYSKAGITKQQGSRPKKEMLKLIFGKLAYFTLIIGLPLFFSAFSWWLILIGFIIMHFIAGIFMTTVFQMAHLVEEVKQPIPTDEGIIQNEWAVHELETTANFAGKSRIFGWVIGGLNYQIEHHLFPNICHIHYKSISPIVKKTAREFGLQYNENRTFLHAIGSHIRMLRALGR
jgi:linoleoyl-CoA desaturase